MCEERAGSPTGSGGAAAVAAGIIYIGVGPVGTKDGYVGGGYSFLGMVLLLDSERRNVPDCPCDGA